MRPTGPSASATLPVDSARDRLGFLHEAAEHLWPGSGLATHRSRRKSTGGFVLLPNATVPRLVVPAGHPAAAAAAVRGYGEQVGLGARMRSRLLSTGLRTGIAQLVLPVRITVDGGSGGFTDRLAELFGRKVLLSMHLSPPRANRKPVLQLLGTDGRLLGFAKVGVNDLTRRLVRTEAAALYRLTAAELPGLITPRVIHSGQWDGLEVLVQSALPIQHGRRRLQDGAAMDARMVAVAGLDRCPSGPLVDGRYWTGLTDRIARLPDGPAARPLATAVSVFTPAGGNVDVSLGSWHGDWSPWNMAALAEGIAVWDWERFSAGVPLGFDALHFALRSDVVLRRRDPAGAAAALVKDAPQRLAPFGVTDHAATATALCYLTELATRSIEDGQAEAGARLGSVQDWLVPVLRAGMEGFTR